MPKKVFVSGCYDMLHSGHVAFFTEAAQHGDLYVGIGSDATIAGLKARKTINTEAERLYMVKALRMVKDAWVNSGSGVMDFEEDVKRLKPDIFFVNEDGHSPAKEELCKVLGIEYVVSKRKPQAGLPVRSTTALRQECHIPYRIDIAGGWLDQPYVSKYSAGAVLTVNIEPDYDFNDRSGMATSSRKKAVELWHMDIPEGNKEQLAKMLFCFENPPGTAYVSGSQDALGITLPALNRFWYENGNYWPSSIETIDDEDTLSWLERHIRLVQMYPRRSGYDVLADTCITQERAQALAAAADKCWDAIRRRDAVVFGEAVRESFEAQVAMFPNMLSEDIAELIDRYKENVLGYKISGAGGGGYLILITDGEVDKSLQVRIRRR